LLLSGSEAKASELYLRTANYGTSTLNIGQYQFHSYTGDFTIAPMAPGNHFLIITTIEHRGNAHGRGKAHPKGNQNHVKTERLTYRGQIFIPPQSRVFARIGPRGDLIIERTERLMYNQPLRPTYTVPYPTYGDAQVELRPNNLRSSTFEELLAMISRESFETTKLDLARQFIRTNSFTSNQVYLMMKQLDFESSKLILAKEAYGLVQDPQNYYLVNRAFDFSSSIAALAKYIG
jgi:hypothetical protein